MRLDLLLAAACLGFCASGTGAALYKWVDEKGRVQYSDKPPSDREKGAVQMTNRGVVVKKLESGASPEEKKAKDDEAARRKAEDAKSAEQRRADNALLQSFTSVQEIDMKRDREVQSIDTVIANLRGQERSVSERLAEDRRRLEGYTKRKQPVPENLKEDVERSEAQTKVIRDEIERRHQEILETRAKYEALKKRYRELREQEQAVSAAPTQPATAAQAPAKK
jgi:chromosome segregation ATPase